MFSEMFNFTRLKECRNIFLPCVVSPGVILIRVSTDGSIFLMHISYCCLCFSTKFSAILSEWSKKRIMRMIFFRQRLGRHSAFLSYFFFHIGQRTRVVSRGDWLPTSVARHDLTAL